MDNLSELHKITSKWLWTLQAQRYSIYHYMILVSLSPNHSVSIYNHPFSSYRPFWHKCTEWAQINANTTRSKVPHICVNHVRKSPISHRSLYDQAFSSYRPFWDKCTECPERISNSIGSKVPHIFTSVPESLIFDRFTLRPCVLELQAILTQVHRNWPKITLNTARLKLPYMCITSVPESQI